MKTTIKMIFVGVLLIPALTILTLALSAQGRHSLDQIRVGQKMPDQINEGGFTEVKGEDCACRIFSIEYNLSPWEISNGAVLLRTVYGIYYNENDTVVGVMEIQQRTNSENAYGAYTGQLSEYMRTQPYWKDRELIKERTSKYEVVGGINYFLYSYDGGKIYRAFGVVHEMLIEETYIPNSSYKPKWIN